MDIVKKILKFILWIVAFLLTIILSLDIILYNIRSISSKFLTEEEIKKAISNVNVLDLLKDQNGKEIEKVTELKQELVDAGLPVETVESFINSEPVQELATSLTKEAVDYVFYGKEIEIKEIKEEDISNFIRDNTKVIINEMQEHNVPKSELLTEEKQEEILTKLESKIPSIKEKVEVVSNQLKEEIMKTDEYQKLENYQRKVNQLLSIIQFIYSDTVSTMIWIVLATCIVGIILTKMSFYSYLKWIGFANILSGAILLTIHFVIPKLFTYLNKIPYAFQNLFTFLLNDSSSLFLSRSISYFIIGAILIFFNIVVWFVLEKLEDKKIKL